MSLNAYYLQQMGIECWVKRCLPPLAPSFNIISPKQAATTLMILLEEVEWDDDGLWLAGKTGLLLKKMLYSIGVAPDSVAIVCGTDKALSRDAELNAHIRRLKPSVIWILGTFQTQYVQSSLQRIPVMSSPHPKDLLQFPLQKKNTWSELMQVKALLG